MAGRQPDLCLPSVIRTLPGETQAFCGPTVSSPPPRLLLSTAKGRETCEPKEGERERQMLLLIPK